MFEHQRGRNIFRMQRLGIKNNLTCVIVKIQMNLPCHLIATVLIILPNETFNRIDQEFL